MTFRRYDAERDHKAAHRIWRETGWVTDDNGVKILDAELDCARGWVADLSGEAECLVLTMPGTVRHLADDLPAAFVTAVTTSRIARKQGFARRLTAQAIAADVADGALVSALGMFEQGFYDHLGFGTGSYVHRVGFDPTTLKVDGTTRPPRRLTEDDVRTGRATSGRPDSRWPTSATRGRADSGSDTPTGRMESSPITRGSTRADRSRTVRTGSRGWHGARATSSWNSPV